MGSGGGGRGSVGRSVGGSGGGWGWRGFLPGASRTFARRRSWGRGALPCRALATRRRARRVAAQRCRSRASRASRPRGFVECARQRRGRGSRREQHCSTFRRLPVLWRGGEREREGSPRERVRSNALYAKLRSRRIGHRISLIGLRLDFGSRESGGVRRVHKTEVRFRREHPLCFL